MLKVSLILIGIALLCLLGADIEWVSTDPWIEFRRMGAGALLPDLQVLWQWRDALWMTLVFAFCGTALGVLGGALFALLMHFRLVRLVCAGLRSIHEIFWAFLFLPALGLSPLCGVLAIAVPYAGIFAKVYAEILEEADPLPKAGLPTGTGIISRFFYATLPTIFPAVQHYTRYRFECALRSSAVLGFIGLPTLGYYLETAFREGLYGEAAALLYAFYFLIFSLKYWLKARLVPAYVVVAFFFLPKDQIWSLSHLGRLFTYEILPWPIRREGVLSGSGQLQFPVDALWDWFLQLFTSEIQPGLAYTFQVTQIVLVASGLIALMSSFMYAHHLQGPVTRRVTGFLLLLGRTTPEYILAYIFILLVGPSMLPAILAIAIHNGAIMGFLNGGAMDRIPLRDDAPNGSMKRFFYELLPRSYGQFLAFLFYRWEVMVRESALLGILGIYTLGFYIDSAIADDKMDKAFVLILTCALFNMVIDACSRLIRRRLKISSNLYISDETVKPA